MAPATASNRSSVDNTQLAGTLSQDGLAALQVERDAYMCADGGPSTVRRDMGTTDLTTPVPSDSDDEIEGYDDLHVDPDTLVVHSRKSMDHSFRPAAGPDLAAGHATTPAEMGRSARHKQRNSIQVRLEKTDQKGRYILTAADPEIRSILKRGLERDDDDAKNKTARMRFRDLLFTRQFTTFDRQNPASAESPFFGFFTLFWICMAWVIGQYSLRNWRDYGSILGSNQVAKMMFSHDVFVLAITDGLMCLATFVTHALQLIVFHRWLNWGKAGWVIQHLWQSAYLGGVIAWAYFREWPWTHTIFAVLHGLVFLMKQHSYAFYNGYLSGVYRRKALLEEKLRELRALEPIHSPPTSPSVARQPASELASGIDPEQLSRKASEHDSSPTAVKRRPSMGPRTSTNLALEKSDVATIASAIQSNRPITSEQMDIFAHVIRLEISDLDRELAGKSASGANAYPKNLRPLNFAEFICLPTLVYELQYPRQDKINWWYVAEKIAATFGVLAIMMVISQAFIYPPVAKTVQMKEAGMPIDERWREFPFIVSDMLFPLLIEQLLTWYLIWECILNLLAELTRFADRGFYGDWWNSVTWDQYARDWNRPVHNFLLRHVYHSSISTFHLSKTTATFVTFLLSAAVHEMCMAIMFKKVRGYLFWSQLMQMPLVVMSRSKVLRGRVVLGNVIFWIGLFVGPSFLTGLYLVI